MCYIIIRLNISFHSTKLAFDIMITSSTNKICKTFISLETFIPEMDPTSRLFLSDKLRPSITKMKSKGESG
jgi:hypothetical protein